MGQVLVACEFSGIVRGAFQARGHDAMSADLLPSELSGQHYQGDVFDLINEPFDLVVAFPPCTYLCRSGAHIYSGSQQQDEALTFVWRLMTWPVPRLALENPIGAISSHIRKPDQIIQPWMFGHGETKATCLWLKGLPKLAPTNIVEGREPRVYRASSKNRWKTRSRTLQGIADAMADQWSDYI